MRAEVIAPVPERSTVILDLIRDRVPNEALAAFIAETADRAEGEG
jgi:hypothetical protein